MKVVYFPYCCFADIKLIFSGCLAADVDEYDDQSEPPLKRFKTQPELVAVSDDATSCSWGTIKVRFYLDLIFICHRSRLLRHFSNLALNRAV